MDRDNPYAPPSAAPQPLDVQPDVVAAPAKPHVRTAAGVAMIVAWHTPICVCLVLLFLGAPPFARQKSSAAALDSAQKLELILFVQALLIPALCILLLTSGRLRRLVYQPGVTREMVSKPLW